jgi:hypothetical protein
MKYIAAETWGLLDLRGIKGPYATMRGAETAAASLNDGHDFPDAGDPIRVGQWLSAQDGLVDGPFDTKAEAAKSDAEWKSMVWTKDGRRWTRADEGHGPVYLGRVVKVHRRNRDGKSVIAIIAVAA